MAQIQEQDTTLVQQLGTIIEKKIDERLAKRRRRLPRILRRNYIMEDPPPETPPEPPIIDREFTRELKGGKVTTRINLLFIKREYERELGPGKVTMRVKLWLKQIRSMMLLSVFCIGMLWLTVSGGSAIIPYLLRILELLPVFVLAPSLLLIPMGLGLSYALART